MHDPTHRGARLAATMRANIPLAELLNAIEADLYVMAWAPTDIPDAEPEHEVRAFTGTVGEGVDRRIATVVSFRLPGTSVDGRAGNEAAYDGGHTSIRTSTLTRLTRPLAQLAFELAAADQPYTWGKK